MQALLSALGEVPFLFARHASVIASYRDLINTRMDPAQLNHFLRQIAPITSVNFSNLSNSDLSRFANAAWPPDVARPPLEHGSDRAE